MRAARHGSRGVVALTVAAMLLGWALAAKANAQCSGWLPTNDEGLPGPNGLVSASVAWDPDGDGPEPEWLVVGGQFDYVGLERANNIAAWDGDQWRTFGGGTSGPVFTLAVHDGQLFAGGLFTTAGGVVVNGVARWDGVQWQALGTGVTGGEVRAMVSDAAGLYIAGNFSRVQGQLSAAVAIWNGATLAPLSPSLTTPRMIRAVAVYNGELYIGGRFTIVGSGGRFSNIARWDGSQWTGVGNGLTGQVATLIVHAGALVAGAAFDFRDGATSAFLGAVASWDGTAWSAVSSNPWVPVGVTDLEGLDGVLHVADGRSLYRLVAGMWELFPDIEVRTISRFRSTFAVMGERLAIRVGDSWETPGYPAANELNGAVRALKEFNGRLIAGGSFTSVGAQPAIGLANWDGVKWTPFAVSLQQSLASFELIQAIEVFQGELIVGGRFVGPIESGAAPHVARWDGAQWRPLGDGLGTLSNQGVTALAVYRGELYATGEFTRSGDQEISGIARWNGSTWSRVVSQGSQGTGLTSSINALTIAHGDLYVGGQSMLFAPPGLIGPNGASIYRWNGTAYSYVPVIPDTALGTTIAALCTFDGDVIAAGTFTTIQGIPANSVARWDGAAWSPLGTGIVGRVHAVAEFDGSLIAAGRFDSAGGASAQNIARWDGTAWHPLGAGTSGDVFALLQHRGELIVGGTFSGAGGMNSTYRARWSDTGVPPIVIHPADATAEVSGSAMFNVSLSPGYDLGGALRYQWRRNSAEIADGPGGVSPGGGDVSGANSPMLTISNAQPTDAGAYDCVITNDCGEVTTTTATLTVLNGACPWDVNLDGVVGMMDLAEVIGAWGSASPPTPSALDLDGSGVIDLGDVAALMAHWGAACP